MSFDSPGYDVIYVTKDGRTSLQDFDFAYIYKFHTRLKLKYIIRLEYYSGQDFFTLKFYPSTLKRHQFKYNLTTGQYDLINIIISCARTIPLVLDNHPNASFGFVGSISLEKGKKGVLRQEQVGNNQRFRVYSNAILRLTGWQQFTARQIVPLSAYALINRNVASIDDKVQELIGILRSNLDDITQIEGHEVVSP